MPLRWEIHGYNTNGGSHFDYYQIDYDNFNDMPTNINYTVDSSCLS